MIIVIVDYEVGNYGSVLAAFKTLGYEPVLTRDKDIIAESDLLVLPGQGAFPSAIKALQELGLISLIKAHIESNKPFIGICLGFQLLFETSYEYGKQAGLGVFKGEIAPFEMTDLKIPHMGWNELNVKHDPYHLLSQDDHFVYFVHSFFLKNTDPDIIFTTTEYGVEFVSAIQTDTVLATQFHPEKSGTVGLKMLEGFVNKHAG